MANKDCHGPTLLHVKTYWLKYSHFYASPSPPMVRPFRRAPCMFTKVGCEGYDYPDDPYILKDSCQLIYSLRAPRGNGGGRGGVGDGGWGSSARSWEDGNNPTWDGRPAGRKRGRGEVGTGRDFGSRLVTWAVLGVVGYVLYNTFLRAAETPFGGGEWDGT